MDEYMYMEMYMEEACQVVYMGYWGEEGGIQVGMGGGKWREINQIKRTHTQLINSIYDDFCICM